MELIYLWIFDDGKTIREQGFNFSDHIRIQFTIRQSGKFFKLAPSSDFIPGFFNRVFDRNNGAEHADFLNVTGIIGENGTGKSNLLKYVAELLSSANISHRPQVVMLKDEEKKEIHVYNALEELVTIEGEIPGYNILPVRNTAHYQFGGHLDSQTDLQNDAAIDGCCIYYAPVFDLNEYPLMVDNSNKSYVDVSTNGLLPEDTFYHDVYLPEREDRVKWFRRANVLRQLELRSFFLARSEANKLIPSEIKINFDRVSFYPGEGKQNLTVNSEEIFKRLDALIDSAFNQAHAALARDLNSRSAKVQKIKVEFIYSFIHNFFANLNSDYHADLSLNLKDFEQSPDLQSAAAVLFSRQTWQSYHGIAATSKLYEGMIALLDSLPNSSFPLEADDTFITVTADQAGEIMDLNYKYLDSLPPGFRTTFLSVGWRNLSTGENALLDLYSRLSYALSYLVSKKEEKAGKIFKTIYLFIDEGESGFHPQWQKEYLFLLLEFVWYRFAGYQVQLFITSHSPFIVSDLPKNNLIFMRREGRYTKIFDFQEQTFAGNIYSLFADQFFIRDGVKGRFAQNALEHYLKAILADQKAQSNKIVDTFIQLIGEPVLKAKLEDIFKLRQKDV